MKLLYHEWTSVPPLFVIDSYSHEVTRSSHAITMLTRCAHTIVPTEWHSKCPEKPIPNKPSWRRPPNPAPHIAPLPEGFAIEAPVAPGPQTTQPASARAKASTRPAPEGSTSTMTEGAPSSSPTGLLSSI